MLASLGIFLGATVYAARFGTESAAAHTLAIRLAGLAYALSIGLTHACAVRSARQGENIVRGPALRVALLAGLCLATFVAAIASPMSQYLLPDPEIAVLATYLVWLVAAMQLADPLGAPAAGILQGQDRTRAAMVYSMIGNWGVSAPLIVILSSGLDLGIRGLWIALVSGAAVSSAATVAHLMLRWRAGGGREPNPSDRNLPADHGECHTAAHGNAAREAA